MKYKILVTRISYASRTFEIEAISKNEAREKVLDVAGNYDFSEHNAEYEVDFLLEKEGV